MYADPEERKLLWRALRHYSAFYQPEETVVENMTKTCEILNILELLNFTTREGIQL